MKAPFLLGALSLLTLLLLSSCVDPNYYTGSASYSNSSYSTMPYGYNTVHVSGVPYYYYGNSWYRRSSGRYISCGRPHGYRGSIGHSSHSSHYGRGITRLPSGYRSVSVGSNRYYNHGNTWYRKSGSRYVTCARPSGYSSSSNHYRSGSSYKSGSSRNSKYYKPSSSHRPSTSYRPTGSSSHYTKKGSSGRSKVTSRTTSPRSSAKPTRTPSVPRVAPPSKSRTPKSSRSSKKSSKKSHPLSKPVKHR